ncbi:shikimate dehydrogenase [Bowmanella dokdonensis]|uniref:Shikimate dehydrogenase (NADP(+)) n=1 Tax=Bowmanella dokdonensis TaxID=751969 RepID=A0A939DNL9_9ALTE|nr:shikimate dehydrogenase [Bowmanella dokdonensis]MBN7825905.1 shikimate dehydrogenase [Bowmanella dokdonensis]
MDKYALFGHPVAHSKSPYIHKLFAEQTNQSLQYDAILSPLDAFSETVQTFFAHGGKGANVTLPFKEQAFGLVDECSSSAEMAGAVNTLIMKDNRLLGENTDGSGLVTDLIFNGIELKNSRVLVLGAGGAAKGALLPLLKKETALIHVANRTEKKALDLARQFSAYGQVSASGLVDVPHEPYDLIINASSASLAGEVPSIDSRLLNNRIVCYDMLYGREETAFNRWAKEHGSARQLDGLGMLVEQAALSFSLWRGVMPDTTRVRQALRDYLA